MISKTKIGKLLTSFLLCFSFGTMFTSLTVTSIGKFATPRGKGGLETSSQPVFLDYSDFMAVADDFPVNPNEDPDFLPDIEIAEEDLVFQDMDDASFYSERELTIPNHTIPTVTDELFVESDSDFNGELVAESSEVEVIIEEENTFIPPKVAVTLAGYEDSAFVAIESNEEVVEVAEAEVADSTQEITVPAVEEAVAELPAETETGSDGISPVKTEATSELLAGLKSNSNGEIKVPTSPELTYQIYRVRVGDTIGAISQKYGLDNDTLFSVNEIKNTRSLSIGSYLKIPSMKGLLYTVKSKGTTSETLAKKFSVDGEKCARINQVALKDEYPVGSTIFIPDAKLDNDTRSEIEGVLWKRPLRGKYYVSSPYGWRSSPFNTGKRSFHTGIDLAISSGTPIYAASSGTVISTGYNAVYGNYVKVQHTGGYQTLYAHMSSIAAKKGQFVDTYTVIGRVGSTGQSTGPHLHFTLFRYGQTINPSNTGLYF